jgi:hypothetical protein
MRKENRPGIGFNVWLEARQKVDMVRRFHAQYSSVKILVYTRDTGQKAVSLVVCIFHFLHQNILLRSQEIGLFKRT